MVRASLQPRAFDRQAPWSQIWSTLHAREHAPQLAGLASTSTQAPAHNAWPAPQPELEAPPTPVPPSLPPAQPRSAHTPSNTTSHRTALLPLFIYRAVKVVRPPPSSRQTAPTLGQAASFAISCSCRPRRAAAPRNCGPRRGTAGAPANCQTAPGLPAESLRFSGNARLCAAAESSLPLRATFTPGGVGVTLAR